MNAVAASMAGGPRAYNVGDLIDRRYELRRDLGRGGTGVVFEARHKFTGRSVALKIVNPDLPRANVAEVRARLLREAQALAAIRHPGVVDILDGGVADDGSPYIVMERLEGRTLEGLLAARGKIPVSDVVGLALQLCGALNATHRVGIVHRDVKPSNIVIVRDSYGYERVKLVDFGIAQLETERASRLTGIGALMGTPPYMSPEQLLALDDIDHTTDIYSLGLTMFECLAGSVPYAGNYQQVLLRAATDAAPPRLTDIAPEVPDALAAIVQRAISKTRAARFATMREFSRALMETMPGARPRTTLFGPPPLPKNGNPDAHPGAPPAAAQRRRTPRAPYITPIRLVLADGVLDGRTEDISEGGALVLSHATCAPEQRVSVRFALPIEGKVITVDALVRWVRAASGVDSQGMRAIGLEFIEPSVEVKRSLTRYVELMGDPRQT
jgi:serine/threonine protein kinase